MKIKLFWMLIIFILVCIYIVYADGKGEGGSGEGTTAVVTQKIEKPKDDLTSCVDGELLKKLDRYLRSIIILNSTNESKSYVGFYILLAERDISCEFKNILEQKGLKITYSPVKNLMYLAFTSENVTNKINEIKNLSFVEIVYPDLVGAPIINSIEKMSVFINLNQNDNISKIQKNIGGKIMYVYSQPGEFGRILEQRRVELQNYDEELRSYYAFITPEIIEDIIALPFVLFIEQAGGGSAASVDQPLSNNLTSSSEDITEPRRDIIVETKNQSMYIPKEKEVLEEESELLVTAKKEEKAWFSKLFSIIIKFFKSMFS